VSFTILYAAVVFCALILVFGVTYRFKGLKVAVLSTAAAFVASVVLLMAMIYAITFAM
jgi:hypothetical protein